jgi:hypothetical protein
MTGGAFAATGADGIDGTVGALSAGVEAAAGAAPDPVSCWSL